MSGSKSIDCARVREALVFFLPKVMSFSASRCASLAFCQVVLIVSRSMRDVTRLRRRARRWAESRPRWRYLRVDIEGEGEICALQEVELDVVRNPMGGKEEGVQGFQDRLSHCGHV